MALLDIFKKSKKQPVKKPVKKSREIPKEESLDELLNKSQKKTDESPTKHVEKKQFSDAYGILESPHVTEKSGMLAEKNNYIFKVDVSANKQKIKKAVQDLYGVMVESVNVINIPKKHRKLGKSEGFRAGYKKAMVKLVKGEKIEIMPR